MHGRSSHIGLIVIAIGERQCLAESSDYKNQVISVITSACLGAGYFGGPFLFQFWQLQIMAIMGIP
jgi:hypothetical protein